MLGPELCIDLCAASLRCPERDAYDLLILTNPGATCDGISCAFTARGHSFNTTRLSRPSSGSRDT